MLPIGRLLVSCRAFGSLNRPLAALAFGAPNPLFEESRFFSKTQNGFDLREGVQIRFFFYENTKVSKSCSVLQ